MQREAQVAAEGRIPDLVFQELPFFGERNLTAKLAEAQGRLGQRYRLQLLPVERVRGQNRFQQTLQFLTLPLPDGFRSGGLHEI